jgi:DNA-binding transcriptional MerR regulator
MLRIGEFARIGRVSVATLRHYDQYGLLKPSALDPDTGYRYYTLDQLPCLNRILALKDLGFPLGEVAQLLEKDPSLERLREMFTAKQAHSQRVIEVEQARLARIAARLHQMEQEDTMPPYDVLLKHLDPIRVGSVRARIPIISERGHMYATLSAYLDRHGVRQSRPDILLLHSRHEVRDDEMSIDVEVAMPVPPSLYLPDDERVRIRTLPGGLVASAVHTGYDLSLGRAYVALHRWVEDNGYRLTGPIRQVHLRHAQLGDPGHNVTDVQFPVEKRNA